MNRPLLAFALLLAGCGTVSPADPTPACVPGASVACVGVDGCQGAQLCAADGRSFGVCECGGGDATVDAASDGTSEGATEVSTDAPLDASLDVTLDAPLDADASDGAPNPPEPTTCAEAEAARSNVGCDFWPTVTANSVWSIFDFAVVAANGGTTDAEVDITGPNGFHLSSFVPAGGLQKFYLPWVASLKGPEANECGAATSLTSSVFAAKGAYHLTSTRPLSAYQFNALEFAPTGGPIGKDWSSCPGSQPCASTGDMPVGCYSYSNDASLLLPTPSLGSTYRITGQHGWTGAAGTGVTAGYVVITATQDATQVTVALGAKGAIVAGAGVAATGPGGKLVLTMNAGDVAELVGELKTQSDASGSLVVATKPVQVITGNPCIQAPIGTQACDHTEESVLPAETLGKDYVVILPTGPAGNLPGHFVRFIGNVNGTHLTYKGTAPDGAPTTLQAGEIVELGATAATVVKSDFEVIGDQPFAVSTVMLGWSIVGTAGVRGDPSQSVVPAIAQFRSRYVFLAPEDFTASFVDVVSSAGNTITIDGQPLTVSALPIAGTSWVVYRQPLAAGTNGAHLLRSTLPVGIQVAGYGKYASYHYPGGMNLHAISTAPTL